MDRKKMATVVISILGLIIVSIFPVLAGPLDSIPIDPNAKTIQADTIMVPANRGSGAQIISPGYGILAIDFSVEGNKELLLMLVTGDQYKSMLTGQKPSGDPLMRLTIEGTASQPITLNGGEYFIALLNKASTDTRLTYRVTWRRGR